MPTPKPKRITRQLTAARRAALKRQRKRIAAELPELISHDRQSREARDEPTLSGELRRAIHAHPLPLEELAQRAGITSLVLDEFLTGERTLRSDVFDRLGQALGLQLVAEA